VVSGFVLVVWETSLDRGRNVCHLALAREVCYARALGMERVLEIYSSSLSLLCNPAKIVTALALVEVENARKLERGAHITLSAGIPARKLAKSFRLFVVGWGTG
jgi:hypothetical protein